MTETSPKPEVTLDDARHRYVISVDGATAGFAVFFDHGAQRVFVHTVIGKDYEGRGLGSVLVRSALDDVRDKGLRVVPICPFVKSYLERHHDYDELVDQPTPQLLAEAGI